MPHPEIVRTRDLAAHGLTSDDVRRPGWCSPSTGVHLSSSGAAGLADRCQAVQAVLPPHAVATVLTAAALRDWWLPLGTGEVPVVFSTDDGAPHHERRGVYVRRCRVPEGHRRVLDGVRIASPAWVIAELAEVLSLIDLVAIIDCARHRDEVTVAELWDVCVKGRRGVRTLRQAIRLSDARSESWWETALRLLHVLCGFTRVRPQAWLHDEAGAFLARADLLLKGTMRLHEYDGGDHLTLAQQEHDLGRSRKLVHGGFERIGYTASVLVEEPGQVVRDAAQAWGVPYDPACLATWWYEMQRSSLSDEGRRRLRGRMWRFHREASPRSRRTAQPRTEY